MADDKASLSTRIGVDLGARMKLEAGLEWAAAAGFVHVDIRLGDAGNEFDGFDGARLRAARELKDRHGLQLGLHTLSAVNMAETAPYLAAATDNYLRAYVDLAGPLGAGWIVVHAGYHFTDDYERRAQAALTRLRRLGDYARTQGVRLLLENMNPEPADAEVRYLACDIPECERFFAALDPAVFGWSFTANHAHMLPVGVEGFYRHFGPARMAEVRLADNRGGKEEHLFPGEGNMDFNALFRLIEGEGYRGHYMLAFGGPDDMRAGRDKLVAEWEASGRA